MYSYAVFSKVKAALEKRRADAIATADMHNFEVRARSSEIAAIDDELTKTGLLLFKSACAGEDIAPLRRRNAELVDRRRGLLRSLGLPADYTEPHYVCPLCRDTGYVDTKMCACMKEMLVREGIAASGMARLIEKQTFDNFDLSCFTDPEIAKRMNYNLSAMRAYAQNFGKEPANLILLGPPGTGKTHLSSAVAAEVVRRGFSVLYDSAQNVIADFEQDRYHSGYGAKTEARGDKYLEADLLIVDDLGVEVVNEFSKSVLYNLITSRENRGLSTIVSTNLTHTALRDLYEARIASRLLGNDYQPLLFQGNDHRMMI